MHAYLPFFTPQLAILISTPCLLLKLVCGPKFREKTYSLCAESKSKIYITPETHFSLAYR